MPNAIVSNWVLKFTFKVLTEQHHKLNAFAHIQACCSDGDGVDDGGEKSVLTVNKKERENKEMPTHTHIPEKNESLQSFECVRVLGLGVGKGVGVFTDSTCMFVR